jgi:hypothetical protein
VFYIREDVSLVNVRGKKAKAGRRHKNGEDSDGRNDTECWFTSSIVWMFFGSDSSTRSRGRCRNRCRAGGVCGRLLPESLRQTTSLVLLQGADALSPGRLLSEAVALSAVPGEVLQVRRLLPETTPLPSLPGEVLQVRRLLPETAALCSVAVVVKSVLHPVAPSLL